VGGVPVEWSGESWEESAAAASASSSRPVKREPIASVERPGIEADQESRACLSELAKRARVSGTVILQVTVDEEGNVSEVKVLRGHPLLDDEAVRAVRQWKYSPTLLEWGAGPGYRDRDGHLNLR